MEITLVPTKLSGMAPEPRLQRLGTLYGGRLLTTHKPRMTPEQRLHTLYSRWLEVALVTTKIPSLAPKPRRQRLGTLYGRRLLTTHKPGMTPEQCLHTLYCRWLEVALVTTKIPGLAPKPRRQCLQRGQRRQRRQRSPDATKQHRAFIRLSRRSNIEELGLARMDEAIATFCATERPLRACSEPSDPGLS